MKTKQKHTQEPWKYGELSEEIVDKEGLPIAGRPVDSDGKFPRDLCYWEADSARIIACVNAMAGIEDPTDLRAQRDALLEASTDILARYDRAAQDGEVFGRDEFVPLRAAIAKCGEK